MPNNPKMRDHSWKHRVLRAAAEVLTLAAVAITIALVATPASGFKILAIDGPFAAVGTLKNQGRSAVVSVPFRCDAGDQWQVVVIVTQGSTQALGRNTAQGACTGDRQVLTTEVQLPAVEPSPSFKEGFALATALFAINNGTTLTALDQRSRFITLSEKTPNLAVINTTSAVRNPDFRVGDGLRFDISGASPNASVFLHLWKDGQDLGVGGPHGSPTDAQGAWSVALTLDASTVSSWLVQAVVGATDSFERSVIIGVNVLP